MSGKTRKVREHLEARGSITSNEAWEAYGVTRLSAIVFNLRRKGFDIETLMESGTDRFGNPTRYGRYVLHEREGKDEKGPKRTRRTADDEPELTNGLHFFF